MALADFACPGCSQKLTAHADTLTRRMRCPRCGKAFRPIDAVDRDVPLPALVDDEAWLPKSEPPPDDKAAHAKNDEPPSLTESWLASKGSPEIKAAEPSQVFTFGAFSASTLADVAPPKAAADKAAGAKAAGDKAAAYKRAVPAQEAAPYEEADDGVLAAETLPEDDEPVESRDARPESTSPSKRGKSGTVILDDSSRTKKASVRLSQYLAAMAGPSERLLSTVSRRLRGRSGLAASIAAPALAFLFLVLLGISDSSLLRWFLAIAAFALGWLVLAVVFAMVVTRRSPPTAQPAGPQPAGRGAVAAALAIPGAVAALLTGAVAMSSSPAEREETAPPRTAAQMAAPSATASSRAAPKRSVDDKLERDKRERSGRGTLYVPPHFVPDGGEFDVLVHFHGSAGVVEQSVNAAKLNAVVQVIGFEKGKSYWKHYGPPGAFTATLDQIQADIEKRGLPEAKIRRVAVSSWSTGYGALSQILAQESSVQQLDAVLILEGLVAGWLDEDKRDRVDPNKIAPFVKFAELAIDDKKLFVITHSNAKTRDYASTRTVTNTMLEDLDIERKPSKGSPAKPKFEAATKLFEKAPHWLEADTVAKKGGFHVLGYKGEMPEAHVAHFAQMSTTALPLLVDRWK